MTLKIITVEDSTCSACITFSSCSTCRTISFCFQKPPELTLNLAAASVVFGSPSKTSRENVIQVKIVIMSKT